MHEGHRQRMYEKLVKSDSLFDHEVLEIMLYNGFTRLNTNPLAHKLLEKFGTISGVLGADMEELMTVDGIGKNVAYYLKCYNECIKRVDRNAVGIVTLKNYDDFKRFTALRLARKTEEVLEIYLLDRGGRVLCVNPYTNNDRTKVSVETSEISKMLVSAKPYAILVAHNHLSGNSEPSQTDDRFTMELMVICSLNGVILQDHCIYASENNVYSYFTSGRIDEFKNHFTFKNVVDTQYKDGLKKNIFRK